MSDPEERDTLFEQTVGTVWREERVSCPHRDILRAFLEGGLEEGAADYLRFHLETIRCPWCTVAIQELQADMGIPAPPELDLDDVTERTLRSTIIQIRSRN